MPVDAAIVDTRFGEGERRLIAAVLKDAIDCFQRFRLTRHPSLRRLYEDAEAWILSYETPPFSFVHICHVLGIDPDQLRARLLAREAERCAAARVDWPIDWPRDSNRDPPRLVDQ